MNPAIQAIIIIAISALLALLFDTGMHGFIVGILSAILGTVLDISRKLNS